MAQNSNIEWTDHTFNPWTGCTKVSPGCAHCYAESWAKRSGTVQWGKGQPRRRTKTWGDPVKWNRDYEQANHTITTSSRRPRVFSASLADWLDDEVPIEWLLDLLNLIRLTPNLDWLLLTKRPQHWRNRLKAALKINLKQWCDEPNDLADWIDSWRYKDKPPANIWIGTTVENQEMADQRIIQLLQIPARIRFLSCEPLLGPINLTYAICPPGVAMCAEFGNDPLRGIHWVIAGGESGPGARPMHPDWPRSLRDQCATARIPFLFKQWGEWAPCPIDSDKPDLVTDAVFKHGPGHDGQVWKVGKKAAGRHLDGQLHTEFPTS